MPDEPDPDLVFCPLDPSPLPLRFAVEGGEATYNGDYHGRTRVPGADVATCFGGRVAVTCVRILPDPVEAAGQPPEVVPMHEGRGGAPPAGGR
jgi:5'-nucleotidase